DIGQCLRADYLIDGSVRRERDRVRITVQLVETGGETHLWAESYDRELVDCLTIQAEVASQVADALALELLPERSARSGRTRHPGAYQAYLKGRFHWNTPGDTGVERAIAYYDEALSLDPGFAAAYSARDRAWELDPLCLTLNTGAAAVRFFGGDFEGALERCRHTLDMEPSFVQGGRLMSAALVQLGRIHDAVDAIERLPRSRMNPVSLAW